MLNIIKSMITKEPENGFISIIPDNVRRDLHNQTIDLVKKDISAKNPSIRRYDG